MSGQDLPEQGRPQRDASRVAAHRDEGPLPLQPSQLIALYGQTATDAMLARLDALITYLAGRQTNPIPAAKLDLSGSSAVRSAYSAWNSTPCSIAAANAVVQAINGVVYRANTGLPNFQFVTLLGSDEALPMARLRDLVTISNELDEASDLAFTTNGLTCANALYAAPAQASSSATGPTARSSRRRG